MDIYYGCTSAASLVSMRLISVVQELQLVDRTGSLGANDCRTAETI